WEKAESARASWQALVRRLKGGGGVSQGQVANASK
ncbi:MAG: hypothetical protein ACJATW_001159, partial [Glaciecola sp.]